MFVLIRPIKFLLLAICTVLLGLKLIAFSHLPGDHTEIRVWGAILIATGIVAFGATLRCAWRWIVLLIS
jgi:hypothetical protein